MNPSIPSFETIAGVMFVLAFLAYTMEHFGQMIFESVPFLDNLLARDGKYLKGSSFKRLFLTLIAWKITSGFHFGVLTLFLRPDFEIAQSAKSLDYFITAGIVGGGSAVVYEYIKRLKATTIEVQSRADIVKSKAVTEVKKAEIVESIAEGEKFKEAVEEDKAITSAIKLEKAIG